MSEQSGTVEKPGPIRHLGYPDLQERYIITDRRGNPEVKLTYTEGPCTATVTGVESWAVTEEMEALVKWLHRDKGA